jgi:hypothetical protein
LIFKEYVQALDRYWHPECLRCSVCGEPIQANYSTRRGQIFHPECYLKKIAPLCAGCGQPILENHISALGKKWHPEHFTCAHCGQPIQSTTFYTHNNRAYCQTDFLTLFSKSCAVCQAALTDTFSVDMWGNSYCTHHKNELPTCSTCSRLISQTTTGGGVQYRDGRQVCNLCRQSAVDLPSLARSTYKEVNEILSGIGLHIGTILSLKLVDKTELKKSAQKRHAENTTGVTRTCITNTNGRESGRDAEIFILHGLPRDLFAATLAHELGHSWLFINRFPSLQPVVEEGFCELMSYLWLSHQNTPETAVRIQAMRKNTDLIYGRGYRAALRAYKKNTFQDLTAFMRLERRFPQ